MKIRDSVLPVLRPVGGEEEVNAIRECIESGSLNVSDMWCKAYNRDNAKTAFENKLNGTDKGRTYLIWMS